MNLQKNKAYFHKKKKKKKKSIVDLENLETSSRTISRNSRKQAFPL